MRVISKIYTCKFWGLFFLFMLSTVWFVVPPGVSAGSLAVVKVDHVNVREGPGTGYGIVGELNKGESPPVLDKSGDWYKVRLSNGSGWVAGWLLTIRQVENTGTGQVNNTSSGVAVVKGSAVNVRSGPGAKYNIVGQVDKGDRLPVLKKAGDWYQVQLSNGSGWVFGWLVEVTGGSENGTEVPESPQPARQGFAVVSKTGPVNLRSGPGPQHNITGQANKGDRFPVLDKAGDWYKLQLPGGQGWIAGWLVRVEQEQEVPSNPIEPQHPSKPDTPQTPQSPGTEQGTAGDGAGQEEQPVPPSPVEPQQPPKPDTPQTPQPPGTGESTAGSGAEQEEQPVSPSPVEPQQPSKPDTPQTPQPPGTGESMAGDGDDQVGPGSLPQKPVPTMPEWLRPREDKHSSDASEKREPVDWKGGRLKDIDVQEQEDTVVITIKATGKLKVNSFTMDNPERLVLDLTEIVPGGIPETIKVSSEFIKQVRTGWFSEEPVQTRVVVDLNKQLRYTTTLSQDKKTLTVELFKQGSDQEFNKIIVIDAGHGGRDPGASGPSGLEEKVVTLDIAKQVAALLEKSGYRVILSRSDDTYVGLYERTEIANRMGADLFVSVHINASTGRDVQGTSTYYRDSRGKQLSRFIQPELVAALGRRDMGIRYANFAVLRTSVMPSALVEVAFISNPEEERLMKTQDFRRKAAKAIAQGIINYYQEKE